MTVIGAPEDWPPRNPWDYPSIQTVYLDYLSLSKKSQEHHLRIFQELTRDKQMEPWEGDCVELRSVDVPIGWSNHPDRLRVKTYFAQYRDCAQHRVNEIIHPSHYFSRPRPILTDTQSLYIFEEQGKGYYVWNEMSGGVFAIKENSLEDIIAKLRDGGLDSMTFSPVRTVDDPSGEPTSNIPYLPNSDFVDRFRLTKNFQIPPQRSVLLYGSNGCGKSELAINYANKVRIDSPETWVFWLCATTIQNFNDDLAAIADILPEGPPTNQKLSREGFVLDWLCTQEGQRWLMVVDDVKSVELGVLSFIDKLWHLSGRGSFIFTTRENLLERPYFTSSTLRLEVGFLTDEEALQQFKKKLKGLPTDENHYTRIIGISWTPLYIELAAAAYKKGLISTSEFFADRKPGEVGPFAMAFSRLINSLNTYERNLLYFVSSFRPPEVPRLWLRSYLEWTNDEEENNELEDSLQPLTDCSLLVKVSGTNAYKMQAGMQIYFAEKLQALQMESRFLKNIKSFVDSRNNIPSYRLWDSRPDLKDKRGLGESPHLPGLQIDL